MPDATTECLFVSHLITQPADAVACSHLVPPRRIQHRQARDAYNALLDIVHDSDPEAVQIPTLLEASKRYTDGGPVDLTWFEPAEIPDPLFWARELHKILCEGDVGRLSAQLAEEPHDALRLRQLTAAIQDLETARTPAAIPTNALGYTGQRLRELSDERELDFIPGLIPYGHMTLLVGSTNAGKSSLAGIIAMAHSLGIPPWPGAERLERGRTWILCPDDSIKSVAQKYRRLCRTHFGEEMLETWEDGVLITAIAPEQAIGFWDKCRLTLEGAAWIEQQLNQAEEEGQPITGLICDAMVDFLPDGISENDNAEISRTLSLLEQIAARRDHFWALMLAHSGHVSESRAKDPKHAARGASSIGAKARSILTLVEPDGAPRNRILTSRSNEGLPQRPVEFLVCNDDQPDTALQYFRVCERRETAAPEIMEEGEAITETEITKRLYEREYQKPPPQRIPGAARNRYKTTIGMWIMAGAIRRTSEKAAGGHPLYRLGVGIEER